MAGPAVGGRVAVVLAAAGAPWESAALAALGRSRGAVVPKRCVDLADLLATAETGRVRVAVVEGDLAGLDVAAVQALRAARVAVVVVAGTPGTQERTRSLGVDVLVDPGASPQWEDVIGRAATSRAAETPAAGTTESYPTQPDLPDHPVVAVWSPPGAPGRTTLAVALGAYVARSRRCVVIDADPAGGAVGQHLGVLDDVSGLLACARLANQGQLDDARFVASLRRVQLRSAGELEVLTGLPRPDRWSEVREHTLGEILGRARRRGVVVVDAGVHLDAPAESRGRAREDLTREAIAEADLDLVVASPDAVGLTRLSRTLVAHTEQGDPGRLHVLVNRMRPGVGWGEAEVRAMIEGFVGPIPTTFLPDAPAVADRALAEGCAVGEAGDDPLAAGIAALAGTLGLVATDPPRGRRPRRTADS